MGHGQLRCFFIVLLTKADFYRCYVPPLFCNAMVAAWLSASMNVAYMSCFCLLYVLLGVRTPFHHRTMLRTHNLVFFSTHSTFSLLGNSGKGSRGKKIQNKCFRDLPPGTHESNASDISSGTKFCTDEFGEG